MPKLPLIAPPTNLDFVHWDWFCYHDDEPGGKGVPATRLCRARYLGKARRAECLSVCMTYLVSKDRYYIIEPLILAHEVRCALRDVQVEHK